MRWIVQYCSDVSTQLVLSTKWERYRHAVPVVTLDGEEIARLRVDEKGLEDRLRGTSVA